MHLRQILCAALVAAAIMAFTVRPARSGGVQALSIPSLPLARAPIVVDGNLTDWPDTTAVSFVPVDPGLVQSGSDGLAQLRALGASARLQACYNSQALYLGITWRGLRAAQPGPQAWIEVHIRTDRVTHLRIGPVARGQRPSILTRSDTTQNWHAAGHGAASAVMFHPDGMATLEVGIPWPLLTSTGSRPANSLTLAIDFTWPGITSALLRSLPNEVLRGSTHLTFCFLTSSDKLFSLAPSMQNPADWGLLKFVDSPQPNTTLSSPAGTGATESLVGRFARPPRIDGSLADWNPSSFQVAAYEPGLLGDRYRARIAAGYDDHFLYIALASSATEGPYNPMAQSTQAGYLGGDCLQIRLNDGKKVVNLCAWYDSVKGKPALTADSHDLANPFLLSQGAKEAFYHRPDGSGYTQEIAIPWPALGAQASPRPGDTWRAQFQVWWSGLGPAFTALMTPTLAAGGAIPCPYTVPTESNVTLALFDAQGHLVRTLVKDVHRRAGHNTEYWDGRDQYGQMAKPGTYSLRGIYHPPIDTSYDLTLDNPGAPPWPTPDGKGDWLSDEAAPQAAATDGHTVYLAAPGSEKGYSIIAVGPDGKRKWGYQESVNPRCVSLALAGNYLYALYSGPELTNSSRRFDGHNAIGRAFIVCLDRNTGTPALFSAEHGDFRIATWPYTDHTRGLWDLRADHAFSPDSYAGQTRYFNDSAGEPSEALGIAGLGNRLYVSLHSQSQILVLDAKSGHQVDTLSVPGPVGLCTRADGRILAVSGNTVVVIDPATKTVNTLIDHNLDAPHDVTTDLAGRIYVSDWGQSFQVKVFSAGGHLIRSIGTQGGRPWVGPWDSGGMLLPRGMAVTSQGELWVAEDDAEPSRVSIWNTSTGAFVRDYIGPGPYGGDGAFWIDPNDRSTVLAAGTLFHVDYAHKTWTPVSKPFRRMSMDEAFTPGGLECSPGSRTIVHNGKQYIFFSVDSYRMVVFQRDGMRLTPVMAMGCLGRYITTDGTDLQLWDSDIGYHRIANYFPAFFRGHAGDNFVWCDENGDGKVEPNEMQWVKTLSRGDSYVPGRQPEACSGWSYGFGPDGAIYFRCFCKDRNVIFRMGLRGWAPSGAPLYNLAAATPLIVGTEDVQSVYVGDDNRLYVARPYEYNPGRDALDCYDQAGKLVWSMARPAVQGPKDVLTDSVLGGYRAPNVGTILLAWLWHANYKPYLITSDGLYVTSLLEDGHLGPQADWDESYRQMYQASNGAAYIINGGNDSYHFLTIHGLGQIHRFSGRITVSAAELKQAGTVAPGATPSGKQAAARPVIHVAWPRAAPTIDGDLRDWAGIEAVSFSGSKGRSARVALARDQANLYLAYDVHGARWVNKGGNWRTLFISGDCVDLMLSSGPGKTHYAPAVGDERLLIAPFQGHAIAVLYRPVVPGTKMPVRLMAATIDSIVRLDNARISCRPGPDGYTMEASVPLSDLGLSPATSGSVRGDVGVIYADETGDGRSLRLYYYNHDTAIVSDLTTEATLQPGEWGEVEFPLGINLLKNGGFEDPLVPDNSKGWATGSEKLGKASIATDEAYTGDHSLLLQQTDPVVFPPASYSDPNYAQFIRSANGGKGGAVVQVTQQAPVIGGHSYNLRLHLRMKGAMGGESKSPGHPRGYDSLQIWLYWQGKVDGHSAEWVTNTQSDPLQWTTLLDARAGYTLLNEPYKAPAGATGVVISIQLVGNAEGSTPRAWIDDVELADAGG